jgi:very-short-patch-repair endonuclease
VSRARELRKHTTKPEFALWQELRQRPGGLKFRRQHPIGPYVVDFCCLREWLVVEIDGLAHDMGDRPARDEERDRFIKENGFRVLRVSAKRVLADVEGTAAAIVARAENPLHRPADGPPPRAGEDK